MIENIPIEDMTYPEYPAFISSVSVTKQSLKGAQMVCEVRGVTNVPNLAALTPESWTGALFDFLLELHQGDYDHFRASCTAAVKRIKDEIEARQLAFEESEKKRFEEMRAKIDNGRVENVSEFHRKIG